MKKEHLYLSPWRYAHAYAIERLGDEIIKRGGTIIPSPYRDVTSILIRDVMGRDMELYPEFDSHYYSWCGWGIEFDMGDYRYYIGGQDNPFFTPYIRKRLIGDKTERYSSELSAFNFHYAGKGERIDYRTENPEAGTTEQILDWILAQPVSEEVKE